MCEVFERAWRLFVSGAPRRALALVTAHLSMANPPPLIEARFRALAARLMVELGDVDGASHVLGYEEGQVFCEVAAVATQIAPARHDLAGAREIVAAWSSHI